MKNSIEKLCTILSVALLIYNTSYDYFFNGIGITESFFNDPLGYLLTLIPIMTSLIISIIKTFSFIDVVMDIIKGAVILLGTIAEFIVAKEFKLYKIVRQENIGKWYIGIVIVIVIILIEGIIITIVEDVGAGSFDDALDYLIDGLPFHYCLFCVILGMQKTIITYPRLFEINNVNDLILLMIIIIVISMLYFIGVIFGFMLLWMPAFSSL